MSGKSLSKIYLILSIVLFLYLVGFFAYGEIVFFLIAKFSSHYINTAQSVLEFIFILIFDIAGIVVLTTAFSNYKRVPRSPKKSGFLYTFMLLVFLLVGLVYQSPLITPNNSFSSSPVGISVPIAAIIFGSLVVLAGTYKKYRFRYAASFFFVTLVYTSAVNVASGGGSGLINSLRFFSFIYATNVFTTSISSLLGNMLGISVLILGLSVFVLIMVGRVNLSYAPVVKQKKVRPSGTGNVMNTGDPVGQVIPPPVVDVPDQTNGGADPPQVVTQQIYNSGSAVSSRVSGSLNTKEEGEGGTIAMVGFSGGGKTTFISLFVYSCQFVKGIPGFNYSIESSSNLVKEGLINLFNGEWPSGTLKTEMRTETRILLSKKQSFRTKRVTLRVNDISGEIWKDIANSEDPSATLANMLRQNNRLSYLASAEGYLITIECSTYESWDTEQLKYLDLLKAIVLLNGTRKVRKHMALVLTKFDMLPPDRRNAPVESILADDLHSINSYLVEHFDYSKVKIFKTGVTVDSNGKPQVFMLNGKKRIEILGGGEIGEFQNIFNWMLEL